MKPLGLSANALAQAMGVPGNRVSDIVRRRPDISADTAIRLGRFFDVDPQFWMNLQAAHDLSRAEKSMTIPAYAPGRRGLRLRSAGHGIVMTVRREAGAEQAALLL